MLDFNAGPTSNASSAGSVEDLRITALLGRHRLNDGRHPIDIPIIDAVQLLLDVSHARHHADQFGERAHLLDGLHLLQEVLESEVFAPLHLAGHALGLIGIKGPLGLLNERQDVAHFQDAASHPVRVESLKVLRLFAGGGKHHRFAGHTHHRQRRTTTGVTIKLGQHHTVETNLLVKQHCGVHRVLANHGVNDEQRFVRLDGLPHRPQLRHQVLIDGQPTSSIDQDDVVQLQFSLGFGPASHIHRIADTVAGLRGKNGYVHTLADNAQLIHGIGALQVSGHQQRLVTLIL